MIWSSIPTGHDLTAVAGALWRGWQGLDLPAQLAVLVFALVTAIPSASNYSPGWQGYVMILAVLLVGGVLLIWGHPAIPSPNTIECLAAALGAWLLASCLWGSSVLIGGFAAALSVLCAVVPWLVLRVSTSDGVNILGFASAAGTLGSLWAAGPMTWMAHDRFVVFRPGLPIGGASNNGVGLVLLAAAALMMAKIDRRARPVWVVIVVLDLMVVVQSVSRVGFAMALALGVLGVLRRRLAGREVWVVTVACVVLMAAVQLTIRGPSAFADDIRAQAAGHSLAAWADNPVSLLFGQGAGTVWPWMREELAWRHHSLPPSYVRESPWGEVLYHSHSTFLAVLVERGWVGFVLLICFVFVFVVCAHPCVRARGPLEMPALVLLLSLPAMLFELYLLRSFPSAMLWWLTAWLVIDRSPRMLTLTRSDA